MGREDWYYPNIRLDLIKTVDKSIKNTYEHGTKKYEDRQDFIVKAIHLLLDVDEGKKKVIELEVTAK